MESLFIPALILAALALALVTLAVLFKSRRGRESPYVKAPLFTAAERLFLGMLEQAVGDGYRVFGKVRVADVVKVRPMTNRKGYARALNRLTAKHFDYVLCAKGDMSVVAAVELDDGSHQRRRRQKRDAFLAEVCRAVGLPLIRVPAQRASLAEIRDQLQSVSRGRVEPRVGSLEEAIDTERERARRHRIAR